LDFRISKADVWDLYLKQNGRCALTGLPVSFCHNNYRGRTASLDRICSKGHYTIDNVQILHTETNKMKNNFDEAYFKEMCQLVVQARNK
jgi:hypothetical protein